MHECLITAVTIAGIYYLSQQNNIVSEYLIATVSIAGSAALVICNFM